MSPAVAQGLPAPVKAAWVESYARRLHAGELKKHEPLLYSAIDAQTALDQLGRSI
jgi:hypothetical protein